jgi:hypothetical protein
MHVAGKSSRQGRRIVAQKPKYDAGKHKWAYDLLVEGFEKRIQEYLTEDRIRRKIREQAKGGTSCTRRCLTQLQAENTSSQ